jgi:tripartite-type tricarboxylate transporter receptor subunit TctC
MGRTRGVRSARAICAWLILTAVVVLVWPDAGRAETPAEFYRGKTVTIVVSSAPGGGYDLLARALSRHLPNHLPGAPQIVVQNMPGAGAIVATNYLYGKAPRDGTVIGALNNNAPFEPLFGTKQASYDPTKFLWLGTPSMETGMLTVWHTTPVASWRDVLAHEITLGASGANSTPAFYGRVLQETLGLKLKLIVGYQSQTAAFLAMERGELDGYSSVFWSALKSVRPEWIKDHKVKLLLQFGMQKEPELPNVPFALDLIEREADRQLMEAACAPLAAGRPYVFPPEVPADRVLAMRTALMTSFADQAFIDEATRIGLDVGVPRSGEELGGLIERIYTRTPPDVVARLRRLNQSE